MLIFCPSVIIPVGLGKHIILAYKIYSALIATELNIGVRE